VRHYTIGFDPKQSELCCPRSHCCIEGKEYIIWNCYVVHTHAILIVLIYSNFVKFKVIRLKYFFSLLISQESLKLLIFSQ